MKRKFFITMLLMSFWQLFIPMETWSQIVNLDISGADVNLTLDPAYIGETYNVVLNPQNTSGDVTWEVLTDLDGSSGQEMEANGVTLNGGSSPLTIPAASDPDISFIANGMAVFDNISPGYLIELTLSDGGGQSIDVTLFVPVYRRPVSLILVLDRSGSMGWVPDGLPAGTDPREDYLKDVAQQFIADFDDQLVPGDQIAVTDFSSAADLAGQTPDNVELLVDFTAATTPDIIADITGPSPTGATSIGAGMLTAKDKLMPGAPLGEATLGNKRVIILFSDGEENTAPLIGGSGGTQAGGTDLNDTDGMNGDDGNIQMYTIGISASAVGDPALVLREIANANNGLAYLLGPNASVDVELGANTGGVVAAEASLSTVFDQILNNILNNSSPQTVNFKYGQTSTSGQATETFTINNDVDYVQFTIICEQNVGVEIRKDGVEISPYFIRTATTKRNQTLTIDFPYQGTDTVAAGGDWEVAIFSDGSTPYFIRAKVDDHRFDANFSITSSNFEVGDDLRAQATLSYNGQPIEDANVDLVILKPGEDWGDVIARSNVSFDPSSSNERGSTGFQKYLEYLNQNPNTFEPNRLGNPMSHTNDGVYEFFYDDTDLSGVYQAFVLINTDDSVRGKIQRVIMQSVVMRFGEPDAKVSVSSTTTSGSTQRTTLTPKYVINGKQKFVGPGFGQGFKLTGNSLTLQSVQDKGDGSYVLVIQGELNNTGIITLSGAKVYEGPINQIDGSFSGSNVPDDFPNFELPFGLGVTIPVGTFADNFNRGLLIELHGEYGITQNLSINLEAGAYTFGRVAPVGQDSSLSMLGLALGPRLKLPVNDRIYLFADANIGYYWPEGLGGNFGYNFGVGAAIQLSPKLSLVPEVSYYNISSATPITFVGAGVGIQVRLN
ncbi:MAG: VWA domain-containing protein [Bacteroidota bacterium]